MQVLACTCLFNVFVVKEVFSIEMPLYFESCQSCVAVVGAQFGCSFKAESPELIFKIKKI